MFGFGKSKKDKLKQEILAEIEEKYNRNNPGISVGASEIASTALIDYSTSYANIDIIHRCVEFIVNALCEIPFRIDDSDKLNALINIKPNAFEDSTRFWRQCYMDYILEGNSFIHYNGTNLYCIPAAQTVILPDPKAFVKGYEYTPVSESYGFDDTKRVIKFSPDEIIHIKADSEESTFRGDSRLKSLNDLIELYYHMLQFQQQFFKNNAVPGLVIETDTVLSTKVMEKLIQDWQRAYNSMRGGARTPAILSGGAKIKPLTDSNFQQLDFENSVERIRRDMATSLGVPFTLLQTGNNANVGNSQTVFYLHTVLPIHKAFSDALSHRFRPVRVSPDTAAIAALRGDKKVEGQYLSTLVNGGIMTPNEARERLRLEPIPDGDTVRIPQNIAGSAIDPNQGGNPGGNEDA